MKEAILKQIILITDGKSNRGTSPIDAALMAKEHGITISTIGIMDRNSETEREFEEIRGIANAGDGIYDLSYIENLGQTLHMLTQKTMNKTIGQVVNNQLKDLIGDDLSSIEPSKRLKLIDYIDNFSNQVNLKLCILLDCSGSMNDKLLNAVDSMYELLKSLEVREGDNDIAVIGFPGKMGSNTFMLNEFADDTSLIKEKIRDVKVRGITPTGPAIEYAINYIDNKHIADSPKNEGLFVENIV